MKVEFLNRYRDKYEFTQVDEQTISWDGPFSYCRFSMSKDEVVSMVDPSGGPYIGVGDEMKYIAPEFDGMVVTALEMHDGHVTIKVSKDEAEEQERDVEGSVH